MKAFLLFALVATLALSSEYTQFETLEKTKLGKTLFDTIAVQLNTGEPLDYLFSLLHDLEDQYVSEQKDDDSENQSFQASCDDDLNALNADIASSTKKSVDFQTTIDQLTPIRNRKNGQRLAKNIARQQLQAVIDANTAERNEEHAEYEEKREEYEYVSSVLAQARRIFTDNLQAPSFLQEGKTDAVHFTPSIMAEVGTHLTNGAAKINKMKHTKSFGKAIKLLASLATRTQQQADQDTVAKIVSLIDQLQVQLNASFDLERAAEDKRVQSYNLYNALLQKDLNKYNSSIANFDAEIASLNDRLDSTANSKADVDQRIADKTEQRDDRNSECQEAAYDYQNRRASRDLDRNVVSTVIGLLNSNLRALKEYIALRLAAGDDLSL